MAGESAKSKALSARDRAERLIAHAERYEKGAAGEARTAEVLAELGPEWIVRHDLAWPGRPHANIDHVVVGPTGVFVIDSKNWSGTVEVRDNMLRQNRFKRDRELTSATNAAAAIAATVPEYAAACFPVICVVREDPIRGTTHGVWVCSTYNLRALILGRPVILSAEHITRIADGLTAVAPRLDAPAPVRELPKPSRAPRRGFVLAFGAAAALVVGFPTVTSVAQQLLARG